MSLADKLRPQSIDDMVGQKHLIGEEMPLRKMIESKKVSHMIIFGPPGVGKTTFANIIANSLDNRTFEKINAINCGVKDIRDIISKAKKENKDGIVLYIDEIHMFSKKVQQSLLEVMEEGFCTLIGSTSENPYFALHKAVLSRSSVFEFRPIGKEDIIHGLARVVKILKEDYNKFSLERKAIGFIAETCNNDMRSAINKLEMAINMGLNEETNEVKLTLENVEKCSDVKLIGYDVDGDMHYNCISAYHKSMRGSDANAAIHYLARLIKAGDMQSITRRLLCVATEDVSLAYPQAITVVNACVQAAMQLGFPEARIPLAQATIYLCRCPKSDSAILAIDTALYDVNNMDIGDIPNHLKDTHYASAKKLGRGVDYLYPHAYRHHYVEQQYLPDEISDRVYYVPGDNSQEQSFENYWQKIKTK